ncbi:Cupin-like domain-containing protein [Salinimicrobium catena]|uniref:Cupin-like domain-containing protein n=1 Tax=Salinimicrobium catena TaxID=390640 RepID=A0A1H5JEI7_9FLAO|nr:cupin-like domain-containing protein [Salinimicrobium catena]SDK87058.1 Cupin-like domain-containing protein [Salinimicrobium catena]SEE50912.1 Cupin-like domain-containing protein [Salinimicrobium catena]
MKEGLKLTEIPREESLSKKDFLAKYVKPQKPVVIEKLIGDWPAYEKWSLDYMKQMAGEKVVPLFDDRPISSKYKFNEPHERMKMGDYIELLKKGPTSYRVFLYHLLKEVPALQKDFSYPNIGLRLLKQIPMLFFGGEGSKVFMHYDIDYANILHFHFHGKKQCILFPPSETKYLYKVPHALIAREDIDFMNPDYEKFPALKKAQGLITELKHGETLYMPEGYWHQMTYLTAGFSMSLRATPRNLKNLSKAVYNVFFMRHFDNYMRSWKGQKWIDYKNEQAVKRTNRKNKITQ